MNTDKDIVDFFPHLHLCSLVFVFKIYGCMLSSEEKEKRKHFMLSIYT